MASDESRQNNSVPFMQIRYIKCSEKVPGLMVAVAGLLTSLWTNCILVLLFFQDYSFDYQHREKYLSGTILLSYQLTHLIIVLTCTAGLILGFKEKNRTYLSTWLIVKLIEMIALLLGCCILILEELYFGAVAVGISFLLVGGYISLYVWITYRKMNEVNRTSSLENVSLNDPNELPLPKDPPSYDSFINVNTHT